MRKFFKSNRIECQVTFTIQTLENVPYMNGKFYAMASSSAGNFKSNVEEVNQHQVHLNFVSQHTLKCNIPSGTTEVDPQYIRCKIYHLTPNKTIKLGRVVVNITEYLSESTITKRFLLQEAKENITVLCSLNMSTSSYEAVSDGESSFIQSSTQATPQSVELHVIKIEKLFPSVGLYKTSEEEIEALLNPNIDFKLNLQDLEFKQSILFPNQ